jgi:glycosyltransferase involved in cell wall biosynthesis
MLEQTATMVNERQMRTTKNSHGERLRIIHVMRAPVGGLFRHVVDLAREQAGQGHLVGLIADASTGGANADRILETLAPSLALGVTRMNMRRMPHWSDLLVACRIERLLNHFEPDVVHGHGAKGGLYARLPALLPGRIAPQLHFLRAYTPHGGSLHYDPDSLVNRLYIGVEKALERVTDLIPFESNYAKKRFITHVGLTKAFTIVVPNGIGPGELEPVTPAQDAADFLYVGELRRCKGVDLLIEALAIIRMRSAIAPSLTLVGSGPCEQIFRSLAEKFGVSHQLRFEKPLPARDAFRLGRILVAPSRAESLPYVVLEAIGAKLPIVATNVGGVPEIFGPNAFRLTPSNDAGALADAMIVLMQMEEAQRARLSQELADYVGERFSLKEMAMGVLSGYREAAKRAEQRANTAGAALLQRN